MARATSALLLVAGAALLVMWVVSPATSAPPPYATVPETPLDRAAPVLADINAQAARLRERLDRAAPYPPPTRNPFTFAEPASRHPAVVEPEPEPEPEATALHLVAILSGDASGTPGRRAVFALSDDADVRFVTKGDVVGAFVVSDVQADGVVLTDRRSGSVVHLALR
jgi:hypothetical protein